MSIKKVLAVGGSDPSGGAGIQADIRTLTDLGVFAYTAITAVTSQNSSGILGYEVLPPRVIREQINAVIAEGGIAGIKTGMLGDSSVLEEVSRLIAEHGDMRTVVDPVMRASDGNQLSPEGYVKLLSQGLLPNVFMVTPNLYEAEQLSGIEISTETQMIEAAKEIFAMGARWVLVKGGHLVGDTAVDILYNGVDTHVLRAKKLKGYDVRGTGCMLASAICALLAKGYEPQAAVEAAKAYVLKNIESAVVLGKGMRQALPFYMERDDDEDRSY